MKKKGSLFIFIVSFLFILLTYTGTALASGYGIYEWSARGNALGGTLVGRADDPSAVAFNPAGITQLEGMQGMTGLSLVIPNTNVTVNDPFTGQQETFNGKFNIWALPHLYLTKQLSDRYWFGLGVFSRVGLGTEYKDKQWWGRYCVTSTTIKQFGVNPNLAVRLTDKLSLAVGLEISYLDFELKKNIDSGTLIAAAAKQGLVPTSLVPTDLHNPQNRSRDARMHTQGDNINYGWNIALHYKPTDWMALGLTYRTKIDMTVDGDSDINLEMAQAYLSGLPANVGNILRSTLASSPVSGTSPIPEMLSMGVAFFPTEKLSLEFDAVLTRWSAFDSFILEFDSPLGNRGFAKNWDDSWRFQFGIEYALSDSIDLQGSYVYDQSPLQDDHVEYMVPANNRHLIGFGLGYHKNNWALDIGYTYLIVESRDVRGRHVEGVYDSRFHDGMSHIASLSFTYKF